MDDEGVADAEEQHGFGDDGDEVSGVDTHDLGASSGGVGERAEDVEDGTNAEGAADGLDGLHGGVQCGGVEEGEAVGAQGSGGLCGGEGDGDAEGFEHICRTAGGGDGAVAVLGYCGSCGGGDEGGGGGDVEGAAGIGSGAAGVYQLTPLRFVERDGR